MVCAKCCRGEQHLKVVLNLFFCCLPIRALNYERFTVLLLLLLWWPHSELNMRLPTFVTGLLQQQNHSTHCQALLDISLVLRSGSLWVSCTGLIFCSSLQRQCNKLGLSLNIDLAAETDLWTVQGSVYLPPEENSGWVNWSQQARQ